MVRLTQNIARLLTLCILWLIVRVTQFLLQVCDLVRESDHVGMAELYLQCDIKEMISEAAPEFIKV